MDTKNIAAIILAGGKGTRMNSEFAKVLRELNGKPIVYYILERLQKIGIKDTTVVVFYQAEKVKEEITKYFTVKYGHQIGAFGTADAFRAGLSEVDSQSENVLVFYGDDSAFYSSQTIEDFIESHIKNHATVSILGVKKTTERPVGGIFRDAKGEFEALMEPNQYMPLGKKSEEINCAYIFNVKWAKQNINKVKINQDKGEYYITELPNMAVRQGLKVNVFIISNADEWIGVNTVDELEYANKKMENLSK